jgi:apolipoprotein N-acyltransferase
VIAEEDLTAGRVMRLQAGMIPIRHLSLALLSGGLLTLAYPGWEISVLAWVALAPLMLAAGRERSALRAFGLGLVAGSLFFYASSWWVTYSPINYADFWPPLAYALLCVPVVVSALFFALFACVINVAVRRLGPHAMLAAPAVWVATEWLRMEATGVGWNFLGISQAFQPALAQLASAGGVYAVSLVVATPSAALAYSALAPSRRAAWRALAVTLVVIVGNALYGASTLKALQPAADGVPVVALQPNLPISLLGADDSEVFARSYAALGKLGREEISRATAPPLPAPALVVWPEMPVGLSIEQEPALQRFVAGLTAERGDYVMLNTIGEAEGGYANRVVVVDPDGAIRQSYDKVQLLPFGEYLPLRSVLPFADSIPALVHDFVPGDRVQLLDVDGARIGVTICFESTFAELAREARRSGASALVNVTNDAWFGPTPMPRQHLAHAIFRSIETRTEQLRVTNSGYSARVDATGRVLDTTGLFVEASRRWIMPREPVAPAPLYVRWGDWLPILCLVGTVALAVAAFVRSRRAVIELE